MATLTEYREVKNYPPGLLTVGYTLYHDRTAVGGRVTAGVAESPAGSGIYNASVTYDNVAVNRIIWDTGTTPSRVADEELAPSVAAGGGGTGLGPGSDPYDLVSAAACAGFLAAGGVTLTAAQQAALPALITAASQEITRYCHRVFTLTSYDEVLTPYRGQAEKGEPDWVDLTNFPVQSVARVASGPAPALSLGFTAAGQRAAAQYAFTGDPELAVTRTGLALVALASGVQSAASVAWTTAPPYTTVAAVAALVSAVSGWRAAAVSPYAPYPAADLWGPLGPANALGADACVLGLFADDLAVAGLDGAAGVVRLNPPRGGTGAWQYWPTSNDAAGGGGFRPRVRVTYAAGWATVPAAIQQACSELVKAAFYRLRTDDAVKSETAKDYTYALRDVIPAMPAAVQEVLNKYRVFR